MLVLYTFKLFHVHIFSFFFISLIYFTSFSAYFIASNLLYFIVSNIQGLVISFWAICDTLEWFLRKIFALKLSLQFAIFTPACSCIPG